MTFELLQELIELRGASGDESRVRDFVIGYVAQQSGSWQTKPTLHYGDDFQDTLILIFGKPRTAVFAHMDSIGFTVGYDNELIKIGGPKIEEGTELVGSDSEGEIETELFIVDDEENDRHIRCLSERTIDRGTILTFKPNFIENDESIQSPYLDNRLGMWNALKLAETLQDGAIVFSTYEEHGGNSVGFCGRFLYEKYGIRQALISDITWVTHGVVHGGGVAISMRDSSVPRRVYLNRILNLAKESGVEYQLEVESAGGSDGSMLQKSDLPFDWCFIGAPENHVHSPKETVFKKDIYSMLALYQHLMRHL